ncbi:MAG: MMPL family transporter, partial [Planctomycetota bacterium]
ERAASVKGYFSAGAPVAEVFAELTTIAATAAPGAATADAFFAAVADEVARKAEAAEGEAEEARLAASEIFKDPDVLRYQGEIQRVMLDTGIVGKSNSLADIVKTVHRDLLSASEEKAAQHFRIPDNRRMVAETLIQFQNSHRPNDLWHFVTPDFRTSSIWVQLKSGDNRDMARVKRAVDDFIANYPPTAPVDFQWFGLTYINVVWQEKMVTGMLEAFAGSFLVVFLLMMILFRSPLWGLLSMIPLTVTIAAIYGVLGLVGKDYDMPVAVLSSLTLGLAVDFAIHFLARSRSMYREHRTWQRTCPHVFAEPARAIARNIIVIAAGFLPLLLAPLVPYRTVGLLLATILLVSGLATLLLLPALVSLLEQRLFVTRPAMGRACNCALCIASSAALVLLLAINFKQYLGAGWTSLTIFSLIAVPVLAALCGIISRREKCRVLPGQDGAHLTEETNDEAD